jgi:hypothetical protein
MLARYFWRKCDYLELSQRKEPIDAIWIEATESEAEQFIFPYLSQKLIQKSKELSDEWFEIAKKLGNPARPFCFLASKNLINIYPCHIHYPFHQLWNGDSPFEKMPIVNLRSLNDIANIEIPEKNDQP